jgi:hypothetical protein
MKNHYSLPLPIVASFWLVSLLLQSCGTGNLPIQREEESSTATTIREGEGQAQRQRLIEQRQEISSLDIFPSEIWQEIFSHLDFVGALSARAVNKDWHELITGYRQVGIVGVLNKPSHIVHAKGWTLKKEIYFRENRLAQIKPETIPSFAFYHLMGKVRNLSQEFWPHLQRTCVHTVGLSWNKIGAEGAEALAMYLQGTCVHTLDLSYNYIGGQGAVGFAKSLQGTRVHTVNLSYNQIGDQGAVGFAKHLQGTRIYTVNLSGNQIGDQGVEETAKHLQQTQVHTINLRENRIGDQGAEVFARNLRGTQVHTIDLSHNEIRDQGAEEFARALQGTQVHTVNLRVNHINTNAQQLLKEKHPHIRWIF